MCALRISHEIPAGTELVNPKCIPMPEGVKHKVLTLGEPKTVNAYAKVVRREPAGNRECFDLVYFEDETKTLIVGHEAYSFELNLNGPNNTKQAYAHLKTLPEFAGAVDC